MDNIEFKLDERRNVHVKGEKEWALQVRYTGAHSWRTFFTWVREPTEDSVGDAKYVFERSADITLDFAKAEVHRTLSNLTRRA